jgi:ferredoxin-NADP reductase
VQDLLNCCVAQELIKLQIEKVIAETADTSSFVLVQPDGDAIAWTPGQFLTFVFPKKDGKEDRRSYSISSSSLLHEPLQITVKRIDNGAYSRWFTDKAKPGDSILTTGAAGFFVLPRDIELYDQLVFFAAGSGITPVFAMIRTALHLYAHLKIVLVYSNASPERTIFYQALLVLEAAYPGRFVIDFLFSKATPRRRLNVAMIEEIANRYPGALFYLCGPLEYMRTITIILRTEGIMEAAIRKEIFHIEQPVRKELPPDILPHKVQLEIDGKEYAFTVQYPVTILQAAKNLQIPLPYSCEAGQCGTCAVNCVSGRVWMWHNDVLLDEEIAKQRVLTCTGYPVDGDVRLLR